MRSLRLDGKIDHHDRVLLDDADQEDHADQPDNVEFRVEQHQRQQRADARGRQRRENGDRVDVALVEHAKQDIDRGNGGEDQDRFLAERLLEQLRRAGENAAYR